MRVYSLHPAHVRLTNHAAFIATVHGSVHRDNVRLGFMFATSLRNYVFMKPERGTEANFLSPLTS
jgi:hypothetical protein